MRQVDGNMEVNTEKQWAEGGGARGKLLEAIIINYAFIGGKSVGKVGQQSGCIPVY